MPISRPVLIALAGAMLAVVAFFATSAARQQDSVPKIDPAALQRKVDKQSAAKSKAAPVKSKSTATEPKTTKVEAKTKPQRAAKPANPAKPKVAGVPAGVARALDRNRVVVLFFRQRGSADDRAVAEAVNAQRGHKGVSVFADSISKLARYRAVVGTLGIAQAPAVVVVDRKGKARVIEGFIDPGSLNQRVVDSK